MKHKFFRSNFILIIILLVAAFFRFSNYSDRVGLGQDSARDAIIALESIENHKLPLLGPPSSAWGFNFGPLYYYVVIFFTLIIPGILAPWVGFTLLSLLTIFLVYKIGKETFDKKFGYILALLCALSFGEINNSLNVLNTVLVSFATALSFFFLSKVLKSGSRSFSFLLGLSVALAVNSHLQALSLISLLPLGALFSSGRFKDRGVRFLLMILGCTLGFLPLIVFEFQHNFAWVKSILDYSLHGQQKFYTPVRWLTEFTQFWPGIVGRVINGLPQSGYFYSGLIILSFVLSYLKKLRLPKLFYIISLTFILEIFLVRFYKGPRSPEYFIIAHQFVLFFVAFSFWVFLKTHFLLGLGVLCLSTLISLKSDFPLLTSRSNAADVLQLFKAEKLLVGTNKIKVFGTANSYGSSIAIYYLSLKEGLTGEGNTSLLVCDNLEDSTKGLADYCPSEGRLIQSGRLVIFDYNKFGETQKKAYQVEELRGDIYYNRTYDNYELRK